MPFIANAWYVVAWPNEVKADAILARTICGQAMVFYRQPDGSPAALEDRCCHRQMPLSLGRIDQGTVRCGYHGLRFDHSGKCVEIPGQSNIPPRARVRAYPIVQKYGWVWVWPGDPLKADQAQVPSICERMDHADWTACGGTTYLRCPYQLISDNLLDLTHEAYLHDTSLGNQTVAETPITVKSDENSVIVQRLMPSHDPAPFWKTLLHEKFGRDVMVDRWQIIHFQPPATLVLDLGVTPAGRPRHEGLETCLANAITPESEDGGAWYFWNHARKFRRNDAALSEKMVASLAKIFEEDRVACEAVHQVVKRSPGGSVIDINSDQGTILARRMVAERIKAEQAQAS